MKIKEWNCPGSMMLVRAEVESEYMRKRFRPFAVPKVLAMQLADARAAISASYAVILGPTPKWFASGANALSAGSLCQSSRVGPPYQSFTRIKCTSVLRLSVLGDYTRTPAV